MAEDEDKQAPAVLTVGDLRDILLDLSISMMGVSNIVGRLEMSAAGLIADDKKYIEDRSNTIFNTAKDAADKLLKGEFRP